MHAHARRNVGSAVVFEAVIDDKIWHPAGVNASTDKRVALKVVGQVLTEPATSTRQDPTQ